MAEKRHATRSASKEPKAGGLVLHKTHNDLKSNAKTVSMQILQERLADGIDLSLVTKQAHWNLKGPQFIAVHEMLDGFRTEQDDWVDTIAERIVQLGGTALGTVQSVGAGTHLEAYPIDIYAIADHLKALIGRYSAYANAVRKNIDDVDEAGDADTADILTGISRGLDKQLWFLEAHTQEPA